MKPFFLVLAGIKTIDIIVSKMDTCPTCSKKFKNVKLHIRKVHDDIAIKYIESEKYARWRADGRRSILDLKKEKFEVYKNGELIDVLDYNWADSDYSSSVKNKEGKILIMAEVEGKDWGKAVNYRLYYGVKKHESYGLGPGVNGEFPGALYCNKFRKIDW